MSDPTTPDATDDAGDDTAMERKQEVLDRFRGTGVGVEDPNIAGDTSPDVEEGDDPGTV